MSQAVQSLNSECALDGALTKMTGRLTVKTQTAWKIQKTANRRGSDLLSSNRLSSPES